VAAFSVGTLSPVSGSPFADLETAPCWVAISHDGSSLYAVNTGSSSISRFGIAPNGFLSLAGLTPMRGAGLKAFDAAVDSSDSFLYVVDSGVAAVSAFRIDGTSVHELGSSPFTVPGGGSPFGIVVD